MTLYTFSAGECWKSVMTFANNLDPDEAPQNVGPHLRSKLFDTPIRIPYTVSAKQFDWNSELFFIFWKKAKLGKYYLACKEITVDSRYLELGYLEFCETQSVYLNQKNILMALSNHNLASETFLQVQITRSAN